MNDQPRDTVPYSGDEPPRDHSSVGAAGQSIGIYLLRERIGVGGMGEVWRAEQSGPIHRTVAIKLIKAGMDSAEVLSRFDAERQALALMDHPCIAKVFDAGTTDQGRPYFAMEYVQGLPIGEYCDKRRLNTRERLELFQLVCHGVQHAHQKAVLHRDLKPSNILVADIDGRPVPKIIDFGVAKATSQKLTDKTMYTSIGQLIGTPQYMSPEQAELTKEDVDTRTDVYSLGVILYELLVGNLPFDSDQYRKAGIEKILQMLREEDPPRPSDRLTTQGDKATLTAKCRRTEPRRLSNQLRNDLDWIVLRALEKDRNRRYGSPDEFAQDIQRHLDNEPVLAGPPTVRYRASKFVRRHRTGVTIATATVLALVAFAVTATYQASIIARERDRATEEAAKASAMNDFLARTLSSADPWVGAGKDATVVDALDAAVEQIDTSFEGQPEVEASMRKVLGQTYLGLGKLEPAAQQIERAVELRRQLDDSESHEFGMLRLTEASLRQNTAEYDKGVAAAADAARILRADPNTQLVDLLGAYQLQTRQLLLAQSYDQADSVLGLCDDITATVAGRKLVSSAENFSLRADLLASRDGNAAAADSLARLAYARAMSIDPDYGPIGTYLNNAAQYHSQSGDYEGALADFDKAVAWCEKRFGTDHPEYATYLENRGGVLYRLGRYDEVLAALDTVRAIRTRNLGPDHINVVRTSINMATVASATKDYERAISIFQELLPTLVASRGHDHPDVLVVLRNLGTAQSAAGRNDEALATLKERLDTSLRMYGPDHLENAKARADYGIVLYRAGRDAEAEGYLKPAFEVELAQLGAEHPTTRSAAQHLVKLYRKMGRTADADRYLEYAGD